MKHRHHYKVTVEQLADPQGASSARAPLEFEIHSHDDIIAIVKRSRTRGDFSENDAAAFSVGLKLLGGVLLEHKENPLFSSFQPHFAQLMKDLKKSPPEA